MNVDECPPAPPPWAISPSGSTASARRASSALVTVISTADPADRNARTTSAAGTPKVKLTTGTR